MIGRFSPACGAEHDRQVALQFRLSDELVERLGTQARLIEQGDGVLWLLGGRKQFFTRLHGQFLTHHSPDAAGHL